MALPSAALEVLGYLAVVGIGTLCFLLDRLGPNGAAVLAVLQLFTPIVLAWNRFDQGRHPCFLFLCVLMLFQGGRLAAYCLGNEPEPLRVRALLYRPFDLSVPEVCKDARFISIRKGESLERVLARAVSDNEARSQAIKRGREVASQYTWEKCGRETLACIVSANKVT
jgi:hypothetical protein